MITQKNLEVDLNLQNVGADMIAMLKGEKQTEDSSNRDFSEDDTLFHLGGGVGGRGGEEGGKITLLQKKLKIWKIGAGQRPAGPRHLLVS